jgi:hypothetical protein
MIITSHMQKIIQIYTCLLKLSRKQEKARVLGGNLSFWVKNHQYWEFCLVYAITLVNMDRFEYKIMIITSHMQKIIQIYTCLLKLSRKQESVTDGQTDGRMDGRTDGQTAVNRNQLFLLKWLLSS